MYLKGNQDGKVLLGNPLALIWSVEIKVIDSPLQCFYEDTVSPMLSQMLSSLFYWSMSSVFMALHRLHQTLTVRALKGQWQGWEVEKFDLLFSSVCSKKSTSFSSCDSAQFFKPHSQFLSMEGVILASCVCFLFCLWIKCFGALITKSEEKRECVFLQA